MVSYIIHLFSLLSRIRQQRLHPTFQPHARVQIVKIVSCRNRVIFSFVSFKVSSIFLSIYHIRQQRFHSTFQPQSLTQSNSRHIGTMTHFPLVSFKGSSIFLSPLPYQTTETSFNLSAAVSHAVTITPHKNYESFFFGFF